MNLRLWVEKSWVIVLFLIFIPPLGIYLMWKYSSWEDSRKIMITGGAITEIIFIWVKLINK